MNLRDPEIAPLSRWHYNSADHETGTSTNGHLAGMSEPSLAQFAIFQDLSPEQYASLQRLVQHRTIARDTMVFSQGESGSGVFLLLEGTVKVILKSPGEVMPWSDHKEVIVAVCGPGEILGEIDTADGDGHSASVTTLEDSTFLWMSTQDFWMCQNAIPELGQNLSRILAKRLRRATTIHDSFATLHLPGKVAFQLLLLAHDYGVPRPSGEILLPLRLTQSDIAALVGASREGVNRVLAKFKKFGLLESRRNSHIVLRKPAVLRSYCQQATDRVGIPVKVTSINTAR